MVIYTNFIIERANRKKNFLLWDHIIQWLVLNICIRLDYNNYYLWIFDDRFDAKKWSHSHSRIYSIATTTQQTKIRFFKSTPISQQLRKRQNYSCTKLPVTWERRNRNSASFRLNAGKIQSCLILRGLNPTSISHATNIYLPPVGTRSKLVNDHTKIK